MGNNLRKYQRLDDRDEHLPLMTIEFDKRDVLINKNGTCIRRINLEDFENFARFEYEPSQIVHCEVCFPENFEIVKEEITSMNSLRRISLTLHSVVRIPSGFFETILTRPSLKQIDFRLFDDLHFGCGIEQEFTKNPMVKELTFRFNYGANVLLLKKLQKMFDALPNIKRVRIVAYSKNDIENLSLNDIENLALFLKMMSNFEKLESLHCAIRGLENSGVQKIQDLLNIVKDFPIKAKVVIADLDNDSKMKNLITKEERNLPKIALLPQQSRYSLYGSSFLPKKM